MEFVHEKCTAQHCTSVFQYLANVLKNEILVVDFNQKVSKDFNPFAAVGLYTDRKICEKNKNPKIGFLHQLLARLDIWILRFWEKKRK